MPRAAVVDPDRGAVSGEQPVRAVAENIEARRQVQRRRQARREFLEQRADVPLQLVALPQAEQLDGRNEGVGDFDDLASNRGGGRRFVEADGDEAARGRRC